MPYNEAGLTALVFTSEGDMRQAVNNLQSTFSGFNFVGADEVFKVCDQPHPVKVKALITDCTKGRIDGAMDKLDELWTAGYSAVDIVTTLFRVVKNMDGLHEFLKLEFIRVRRPGSLFCLALGVHTRLAPPRCMLTAYSRRAHASLARLRARRRSALPTCAFSKASRPSCSSAASSRACASSA